MASVGVDSVQLRDERYDQIVHMVSAANGAERFYQLSNNPTRSEGLKLAREQDDKAAQVRDNLVQSQLPLPQASNPAFPFWILFRSFGIKIGFKVYPPPPSSQQSPFFPPSRSPSLLPPSLSWYDIFSFIMTVCVLNSASIIKAIMLLLLL